MVRRLLEWALASPLIVILLAIALAVFGGFAFNKVNVEAYPDPAPAIIEVVAQYPGASAEEVERQVTIPLEIALAGMPHLKYTRSKSLFGLSHIRNQFEYGFDYQQAKQEVINRLSQASLPTGVTPQISPQSPTGEIYRYMLKNPRDALGRPIYTLNDLKALQDWTLEREFKRIPRIADVSSYGGTIKRYEIQPDPNRLQQYGITLQQLQNAVAASNANVGGDYLAQGPTVKVVCSLGLLGQGRDPMQQIVGLTDPVAASRLLRDEEERRCREIRDIVLAATNNVAIRVEDVVDGGPTAAVPSMPSAAHGPRGVIVGHQTRQGRIGMSRAKHNARGDLVRNENGNAVWEDDDDIVMGVVLLRKGEDSLPALHDVKAKVKELNETPGRLPPGVQIVPLYDRERLINITTETVRENLGLGMALVTVILLMFLSNVRSALIVAINIPLALLFAFSVLFLRGKSANLLSIGAVDFGIIVDSSVIMVENIYRHLRTDDPAYAGVPLRVRILRAGVEMERSLFFTTIIMVCAFLPLFTMQGPEGQIFGPMADTYAFALGGALLLAMTLSPVLCLLLFRRLKAGRDNFLVRSLRATALGLLRPCLAFRWVYLAVVAMLIFVTVSALPFLGQDFMPELEEGNCWIRGTFPVQVSLEEATEKARLARNILSSEQFPEVETVISQVGRPDDGTDPTGFYNTEFFVPLKPPAEWPVPPGHNRARTKAELVEAMDAELSKHIIGIDWNFSQYIRDNVMEILSGIKGENSVKIFGPDLDHLEKLADQVKTALEAVPGIKEVGIFRIKGQTSLELPVDRRKCARWNVNVADVQNVIQTAVGGQAFTQVIEGEKKFDLTLRWPEALRRNVEMILDIPVDVSNHTVTPGTVASVPQTPVSGQATGLSLLGTSLPMAALLGGQAAGGANSLGATPRRRLKDLVTPLDEHDRLDPHGSFVRSGASTIYREQGNRLIAVKFSVMGRDLGSAVAAAQQRVQSLITPGYRTEWSGEFQEMQEAQQRLIEVVALALGLILLLLYLAFHSMLDVLVVFSNVLAVSLGGIWALLLTGTNFNISAAVGFISILGVGVMNGLILVSSFNQHRAQGMEVGEAIARGLDKRIRPLMMTLLTAILGLLPAALSTQIGAQTQRPLAIVVVGGMLMTMVLTHLIPVLYSFYGHRDPPAGNTAMAH